jgi:hypothetical protein
MKDHGSSINISYYGVDIAVIIKIGDGESSTDTRFDQSGACLLTGIAECAIPLVQEEVLGLTIARS